MIPLLEQAEKEGRDVYLETSKEVNIAIYKKRGFEVYDQMPQEESSDVIIYLLKKAARSIS